MAEAVAFYHSLGLAEVLVAYGWGCDCPDADLYQDRVIPLSDFERFVSAAESADYYRVSKDDLLVRDAAGSAAFVFCHESDIHFATDRAPLLEEIRRRWQALGFERVTRVAGGG